MNYREVVNSFLSKPNTVKVFIGDVHGSTDMLIRDHEELNERYTKDKYEFLQDALLHLFNYDNEQNEFLRDSTPYQSRSRGLLSLDAEQITQIDGEKIKLLEIDGNYYVFGNGNHRIFALLKYYMDHDDGKSDAETKKRYSITADVTHLLVNETYSNYVLKNVLRSSIIIEDILDERRKRNWKICFCRRRKKIRNN